MEHLTGRNAGTPPPPPGFDAPLAPKQSFWVIGDIHGQIGLLDDLLTMIRAQDPDPFMVFVGDYVDRGEHSREVLERVRDLARTRPDRTVTLIGNHEVMLLDFVAKPQSRSAKWLRYGGMQTLASYGIGGLTETSRGDDLDAARDRLVAAMDVDMLAWLSDLPTHWQSGNVHVVHAGADPAAEIGSQSRSVLVWGHPDMGRIARTDAQWLIVGHTIVPEPRVENGVISVDTGGVFTGRLTAAHFREAEVRFISTGG
jgi:serine/threonine protein phosphatase 1